jgi:hypothetical protein
MQLLLGQLMKCNNVLRSLVACARQCHILILGIVSSHLSINCLCVNDRSIPGGAVCALPAD